MRDSQRQGLKAAARIAFSVVTVGCGSATTGDHGDITVGRPVGAPGSTTPTPRPPVDCPALIAATFPTAGEYPGTKLPPDPDLTRCCEEILLTEEGYGAHRWDCCAQLEPNVPARIGTGCSPWGPPTPPGGAERAAAGSRPTLLDLREAARAVGLRLEAEEASDGAREAAVATWRARMENEHGSSRVFVALAAQLEAAGFADAAAEAAAFAAEEIAHGARCGAVVEALGGAAVGSAAAPEVFPLHLDAASPREAALRNVLSIACLSETVAVALIGAERAAMPRGPLHDLLTSIWADEIGHARFGWRLLDAVASSLTPEERDGLERYLEVAIGHLVEHELKHLPAGFEPPAGGESLGLCSGREAQQLFAATLDRVIIPALAQRGLRSRAPRSRSRRRRSGALRPQHEAVPSRRAGSGRGRASSRAPAGG